MNERLFLSVGEAMVELSQAEGSLWRLGFAGDTLNTAWYARAGLPAGWTVAYFTRIGADPFSERMRAFLEGGGIDTRFVSVDPTRSIGLYAIALDDGERSFSYWRGESAAGRLADDEAAVDAAVGAAELVYLSGITLAILPPEARARLLDRLVAARAAGRIVAFDPNIRPRLWESEAAMRDWLRRAGAVAGIALPSFDDEARVFDDAGVEDTARRWADWGAAEVAVKNGGGPIALLAGNAVETLAVERVRPVDATGAGDAFNGGYLAARLGGQPPAEAAQAAHTLAARVIRHPGALIPADELGHD